MRAARAASSPRLDPAADVKQGQEAELWVDATKLQLFDPDDGRNLMVDSPAPAAVGSEAGGRAAGYLNSRRSFLTIVSSSEPRVLEVAPDRVDYGVGPVVRAQEQIAQVRDLHVRLGVAHALRHELRLAQHLHDRLVLLPEPRLGRLLAR